MKFQLLAILKTKYVLAIALFLINGLVVQAQTQLKADGLIDPGITLTDSERLTAKAIREPVKPQPYVKPQQLNDGLAVEHISQQFKNFTKITELSKKISLGDFNHIESLLISKNGKLVFEQYWQDAAHDKPHFVASITKNMISNAIGKAIELGLIHSVDEPIVSYFPEFDKKNFSQGVESITIGHLLSMRSGLRFSKQSTKHENNYLLNKHVEYFLTQSKPVANKKTFKYQHSDPEILAHLIHQVSGLTPQEFLTEHYFKPLGITNFTWENSSCGISKGAVGLALTSRDMMKIGQTMNNQGLFNNKSVLSGQWLTEALKPRTKRSNYGYFWWLEILEVERQSLTSITARGARGQFIYMVPKHDLVVVVTSNNNGVTRRVPLSFIPEYIVSSLY